MLLESCADEDVDEIDVRRNDGLVQEGLLPARHLLDAGFALDQQLGDGRVTIVAGEMQWCGGVFLGISLLLTM